MNLDQQIRELSFHEKMMKWAQLEGLGGALSSVAQPAAYGLGGYALSRGLGLGERMGGVPDWLLGPTMGLGVAMPAVGAIRRALAERKGQRQMEDLQTQQQQLQESLMQEQALQEQARQLLAASQMQGMPMEALPKFGEERPKLKIPAQQADQVAAAAAQKVRQQQQQTAQQQMATAAIGQAIKSQFRGLSQAQTAVAKRTAMGKR